MSVVLGFFKAIFYLFQASCRCLQNIPTNLKKKDCNDECESPSNTLCGGKNGNENFMSVYEKGTVY